MSEVAPSQKERWKKYAFSKGKVGRMMKARSR
jgi:hypothetical protein